MSFDLNYRYELFFPFFFNQTNPSNDFYRKRLKWSVFRLWLFWHRPSCLKQTHTTTVLTCLQHSHLMRIIHNTHTHRHTQQSMTKTKTISYCTRLCSLFNIYFLINSNISIWTAIERISNNRLEQFIHYMINKTNKTNYTPSIVIESIFINMYTFIRYYLLILFTLNWEFFWFSSNYFSNNRN